MKIMLIKPNQESNEIIPPLGLGYLASSVRNFAEVMIWDCIRLNWDLNEFSHQIKNISAEVFGIQVFSSDIFIVKKYVEIIRKIHPNSIIILGGPHISTWSVSTFSHFPQADFAFRSEAEIGLPMLIKLIENFSSIHNSLNIDHFDNLIQNEMYRIPGLIFRFNGSIIQNKIIRSENLDLFNPSYDLLHLEAYPVAPHGGFCKNYPVAPIIISRGCPNQCNFCAGPIISGIKIRYHSVEFIINQLKMLKRVYRIREFHIEDDNFTANRNYTVKLLNQLIQSKINLTWTAANGIRLDTLDEELLSLMKESGMYAISVGIESGSDRIRKKMGKNLSTTQIIQKIHLIQKFKIDLIGFFILGYPGETADEINQTIRFACGLPLKRANFAAFKPLPGTPVFYEMLEAHKITRINWSSLTLHNIAWAEPSLGQNTLDKLRKKALWKFYFRPHILWKLLIEIKTLDNLKMVILRIYRLLLRKNAF